MRHEPDPAKPEGIARPPIVEAINAKERAWSFVLLMGDLARACDRDGDTDSADTYRVGVEAVDLLTSLLGVVSAGDTLGMQAITEASADLLGWCFCADCGDLLPVHEITTAGLCDSCVPSCVDCGDTGLSLDSDNRCDWCANGEGPRNTCTDCGETGRVLDSEGLCTDCGDDSRDAYGAPYGGGDGWETKPCRLGHLECSHEDGGDCWQEWSERTTLDD